MSARHHTTGAQSGVQPKRIDVDYFARTEGEAGLHAVISDGRLESMVLDIWEPPRFFEGWLVGRMYYEVPEFASRICGICPVSHHETATKAVEKAIGLKVDENTTNMRRLISWSQIVASHIIHLYMLALPDYVGHESVITMMPEYPDEIKRFLRMKTAANAVTDAIGGRALHTMSLIVGGFTRGTSNERLKELGENFKAVKEDAIEMTRLFAKLGMPEFKAERNYVSLTGDSEYPVNSGTLVSSEGLRTSEDDYRKHFRERQVPTANTKYTSLNDKPVRVGAISRVNNNFDLLSPDAKALAKEIDYKVPNHNPLNNNLAQALEVVNGIDGCVDLINRVDAEKLGLVKHEVKGGEGGGITEAPRGSLYHWYRVNKQGVVEAADIVTPTAHNAYNLETDLRDLISSIAEKESEEIKFESEKLVRAYDPCFSCSVHIVKI